MKNFPEKGMYEIAVGVCVAHGIDLEHVRTTRACEQEVIWIRAKIACACQRAGWGFKAIGRFLNRNHATIMHMCKEANEQNPTG